LRTFALSLRSCLELTLCLSLRTWSYQRSKDTIIVKKKWSGSVNRLHCRFYPSRVGFFGKRTNFIRTRTTFSGGPSTGKIWFGTVEIWHGESHLHCKIHPSRTNFFGTRTIFIRAVPKIFGSVNRPLKDLSRLRRSFCRCATSLELASRSMIEGLMRGRLGASLLENETCFNL